MGQRVSRTDFEWVYTDEPHATRRKQILEKYPQVKQLMGTDDRLKWIATLLVVTQCLVAYALKDASWTIVFLTAYLFGGVLNHSLSLAIHEMAHNLAFGHGRPLANRFLSIWANLPLGVPASITFKKYHLDHHKYQGDDYLDVDIPSRIEAKLFTNTATKLLWVLLQPFFYAIRPLFMVPKPATSLEVINFSVQLTFDVLLYMICGPRSLVYLIAGTLLCFGLHPVAGHFISEHYMFYKGYETYSYYGPLNALCFNVGYHVEHHDFPNIPGSRLPKLKEMCPDFYNNNPCHYSWTKVLWDFVTDPDIGPYSRVKRLAKSKLVS